MATSDNPFRVLGIDSSALRGLTDTEAAELVQGFYRALMRVHHSDVGGSNPARAADINRAKDELNDPAAFRYWKTRLLRGNRGRADQAKILELEEQASAADSTARLIGDNLIAFLENAFWPVSGELSAFNLVPSRVLLNDVIGSAVQEKYRMKRERSFHRPAWFEVYIDVDGSARWFETEQVRFNHRTTDPPRDLAPGWVRLSDSPGAQSRWIKRIGEGTLIVGVQVIGSINREAMGPSHEQSDLKSFEALLPPAGEETRESEGFPLESFRQYLPYLVPQIKAYNVLVGVRKTKDELRFVILGGIIAVWIL